MPICVSLHATLDRNTTHIIQKCSIACGPFGRVGFSFEIGRCVYIHREISSEHTQLYIFRWYIVIDGVRGVLY